MKERIFLNRVPAKRTIEEFLEGLDGEPTVVFNKEKGSFETKEGLPLCEICGGPLTLGKFMNFCPQDKVYFPK